MYVVYSETNWGYDGGSSTSLHAIVYTEEEAKNLVNELNANDHSVNNDSASTSFDFEEVPIGKVINLSDYNSYNIESRAEDIFVRHVRQWIAGSRGAFILKCRLRGGNFPDSSDIYRKLDLEERKTVFIDYVRNHKNTLKVRETFSIERLNHLMETYSPMINSINAGNIENGY